MLWLNIIILSVFSFVLNYHFDLLERIAESHEGELDCFNETYRYLKTQGVDLNVYLEALQAEYDSLQSSHAELSR